jgi:hypothetical protein
MADVLDIRSRQKVVTKFLTADEPTPAEIHTYLRSVCGEDAIDARSVRRWVRYFKCG